MKMKMKMIGALGWNEDASNAAVRQCEGNVTAAVEMLQREEVVMLEQFESAVNEYLEPKEEINSRIEFAKAEVTAPTEFTAPRAR